MHRLFSKSAAALALASLVACGTVTPPEPLKHSATFEPVYPRVDASNIVPTGAIYNGRQSESWFG